MTVDVDISKADSVGCMEQFGGLREVNQNIGLCRSTPANISAFLRDSPVERRNPAARTLQPSTQRLERRAVVISSARQGLPAPPA